MKKLNVLLAVTDQLRAGYKGMISDYSKFFSGSQGAFKGERKTYVAREGCLDDPSMKKFVKVVTTVDEKVDYLIDQSKEFINAMFSQELTNSIGVAKAELIVDGEVWGKYTSLELLRLKALIESTEYGNLKNMIAQIPVRSDNEIWNPTDDATYADRNVWSSGKTEGVTKTTEIEMYVMEDPNVKHLKDTSSYTAPIGKKHITKETGDYTYEKFSGEWSHVQRANALKRLGKLHTAVIEALKEANDVEAIDSTMTAEKIFKYIFEG